MKKLALKCICLNANMQTVEKVAEPIISKSPRQKLRYYQFRRRRRAILEHSINESCCLDAMILVNKFNFATAITFFCVEQSKVPL